MKQIQLEVIPMVC